MAEKHPRKIPARQRQARLRRCQRIAGKAGFTGQVEYRHVFSSAGGAQYGIGTTPETDLLTVYADAFVRDADPEDFSLEAIIAHERGHQLICRHPGLSRRVSGWISGPTEEILASLLGSLVVEALADRESLLQKALFEAIQCGLQPEDAVRLVSELRTCLEQML